VCSALARINRLSSWYASPIGARTLIQEGRRWGWE
jgi:hypothetical protein